MHGEDGVEGNIQIFIVNGTGVPKIHWEKKVLALIFLNINTVKFLFIYVKIVLENSASVIVGRLKAKSQLLVGHETNFLIFWTVRNSDYKVINWIVVYF